MKEPHQPVPGVSRTQRLSDEGLRRLVRQLESGAGISDQILRQWIQRYGDEARKLILDSGQDQVI